MITSDLATWQGARFDPADRTGHYESWFLRANHPAKPEAFWIRYTIFRPAAAPDTAEGELWAIHFDGVRGRVRAAYGTVPASGCRFARSGLSVAVGAAVLEPGRLTGEVAGPARIAWDLTYRGGGAPLPLLADWMYRGGFPRAKSVVTRPLVAFTGRLTVDGETIDLSDWIGSENHNWGSRHTDRYAWAQVAGFDDSPDCFLELITARVKLGALSLPPLTILALVLDGRRFRLNGIGTAIRAEGQLSGLEYRFRTAGDGVRVSGRIAAPAGHFVGLTYRNPPGGAKICLNTKLAACDLTVELPGQAPRHLATAHRAALEILGDEGAEGIPIVV